MRGRLTDPWPYSNKKVNSSCRTDFLMSILRRREVLTLCLKRRKTNLVKMEIGEKKHFVQPN